MIAVEPDVAACLTAALAAGEPVMIATPGTAMAGLDCAVVSAAAWDTLHAGITGTVTVSDAETARRCASSPPPARDRRLGRRPARRAARPALRPGLRRAARCRPARPRPADRHRRPDRPRGLRSRPSRDRGRIRHPRPAQHAAARGAMAVYSSVLQLVAAVSSLTFVLVTGVEGLLGLGPAIFLSRRVWRRCPRGG